MSQGIENGEDDCDAQSLCFNGECVAFCAGDQFDPICADGLSCLITNGGVINLCFPACDPLMSDCDDGEACIYNMSGDDFTCVQSQGAGAEDEMCEFINSCAPGLACVSDTLLPDCPGFNCCTPFCDLDQPNCGGNKECVPFFEQAPDGFENVGICASP